MISKSFLFQNLYLILFIKTVHGAVPLSAVLSSEQTLATSLMTGYSRNIRPVDTVEIGVGMAIKQIINIDEKNQILTLSCYISQYWYDGRLSWTPASYNNLQYINMPLKNVWLPDTMILNSADGDGYLKINSDFGIVQVNSDGIVYYLSPLIGLKTRCSLNVQNYPFDKQICNIRFSSWGNDDSRLSYGVNDSYIDIITDYTPHPIWNITNTNLKTAISGDRNVFADSNNTDIILSLTLQRKSLYYMMNTVFPCFILNLVTLLTFFMPYGNQLGLAMTGFLTFSVYSLRIASDIPVQSDYLPKISWYFITSISYNLMVMLWYISRNNIAAKKGKLPKPLDIICTFFHKKIFFFCFDDSKSNKTAPEKEKTLEKLEIRVESPNSNNFFEEKKKGVELSKEETFDNNKTIQEDVKNDAEVTLPEPVNLESKKIELMNDEIKKKCNLCDRCEDCEADFKKEKDKGKNKKEIDAKLDSFNYFLFFVFFIAIFITQLSIWTSLSS